MCLTNNACEILLGILPGWECCAFDAIAISRGILVIWNPCLADLKPFVIAGGILLEGKLSGLDVEVKILNCYESYAQCKELWESVDSC